jgi:hypothetical protein
LTSEYDIPGQLLYLIKQRVTDPVARRAIELFEMYFAALHTWSHTIAKGELKTPPSPVLGHVKIPKSDHWMSSIPALRAQIDQLDHYLDNVLELGRQKKKEAEDKCTKVTGLCLLPCCSQELWGGHS